MKKLWKALAAGLSASLMLTSLSGCGISMSDYSTTVAATYGDENIYLDEANFFLRYEQWYWEASYSWYATYLGYSDLWEMESGSGTKTMAQYLKETVMAELLQTYILLDHADEYGVSLTSEDEEKIAAAVAEMREDLADEFLNYSDATDEQITGWLTKNALALKVYDAVKESAEVEVTEEECSMFTVQYVYISQTEVTEETTEETEEDTENEEVTEDETTEEAEEEETLYNEDLVNAILACVKDGEDLDVAAEEWGESASTASYLRADTEETSVLYTCGVEMVAGEITTYEVEDSGWYIIQCVSEEDEEATQEQRASVIDEKQEEYFNEVYATWTEEASEFTVQKCWNNIKVTGTIYVEKTTEETEEETEEPEIIDAEELREDADLSAADDTTEAE